MTREVTTTVRSSLRRLRVDLSEPADGLPTAGATLLVLALAGLFLLVGGGNLDLGPIEARQGLAAGAGLGPVGVVAGGYDPTLWPLRVGVSAAWAWAEGQATAASVRWPDALAALAIGLIVARRLRRLLGERAGLFGALCLFGSVAFIDRSAGTGLDLLAGLGVVGAIDRILARGSDAVAGLWAALAVLAGGWPPLALVLLSIVIVGRAGRTLSAGLLLPPLLALVGWSAWCLATAPGSVWGAALALPLTQGPAWWLGPEVVLLGLPWSPLALVLSARSARQSLGNGGRELVVGWLQVAGVALLGGSLIPGLGAAAPVPAVVGLAVAAAAVLNRAWAETLADAPRRLALGAAGVVVALWVAVSVLGGSYLAAAVSYYRPLAVVLAVVGLMTGLAAAVAIRYGRTRGAVLVLLVVAFGLKLAHWGYYVPEWNYRRSQGPWGRAIGQWVLPNWTLHTLAPWPADLLFATGRPVQQLELRDLRLLQAMPPETPKFFLLRPEEWEFWSEPLKLVKLRELEDPHGQGRIVARTPGEIVKDRMGED